ncbi:hypothetical protein D9757_002815 [Collybiopsis confluens]|uniref:FAM192A/Fyv6 N-terminal domain-containing protein n=1 Tax=Collybiopsis confluens TaxID=2823264 RepID=A0A8H5HVY3_9AGAR|nr:hypothetical protein D9757_002815 [Collybiopsis confluens]
MPEPPPQPQADAYDGRSLAEVLSYPTHTDSRIDIPSGMTPFKLAANRAAKQEEWEEKNKLANQFRALEEDEIMFLDSIREKTEAEEKARREMDGVEVKNFREAVAARIQSSNPPPALSSASTATTPKKETKPPLVVKKDPKKALLKGVVVKKKKIATKTDSKPPESKAEPNVAKTVRSWDTDPSAEEPNSKRRRISESDS